MSQPTLTLEEQLEARTLYAELLEEQLATKDAEIERLVRDLASANRLRDEWTRSGLNDKAEIERLREIMSRGDKFLRFFGETEKEEWENWHKEYYHAFVLRLPALATSHDAKEAM